MSQLNLWKEVDYLCVRGKVLCFITWQLIVFLVDTFSASLCVEHSKCSFVCEEVPQTRQCGFAYLADVTAQLKNIQKANDEY